ncbi:hypothetical protein FHT02_003341 [Sphingomonas xinjiangensis]|uniref:Uncharacterized protein n=1 Tax=Sphingomonas xinjiangensis TaxID=643568 RepID=A0A840YI48_9SPHN|nr:hypothetical protein [Sphingomonas xinjiangensis]
MIYRNSLDSNDLVVPLELREDVLSIVGLVPPLAELGTKPALHSRDAGGSTRLLTTTRTWASAISRYQAAAVAGGVIAALAAAMVIPLEHRPFRSRGDHSSPPSISSQSSSASNWPPAPLIVRNEPNNDLATVGLPRLNNRQIAPSPQLENVRDRGTTKQALRSRFNSHAAGIGRTSSKSTEPSRLRTRGEVASGRARPHVIARVVLPTSSRAVSQGSPTSVESEGAGAYSESVLVRQVSRGESTASFAELPKVGSRRARMDSLDGLRTLRRQW